MDFKNKYIKYKNKYLDLQNKLLEKYGAGSIAQLKKGSENLAKLSKNLIDHANVVMDGYQSKNAKLQEMGAYVVDLENQIRQVEQEKAKCDNDLNICNQKLDAETKTHSQDKARYSQQRDELLQKQKALDTKYQTLHKERGALQSNLDDYKKRQTALQSKYDKEHSAYESLQKTYDTEHSAYDKYKQQQQDLQSKWSKERAQFKSRFAEEAKAHQRDLGAYNKYKQQQQQFQSKYAQDRDAWKKEHDQYASDKKSWDTERSSLKQDIAARSLQQAMRRKKANEAAEKERKRQEALNAYFNTVNPQTPAPTPPVQTPTPKLPVKQQTFNLSKKEPKGEVFSQFTNNPLYNKIPPEVTRECQNCGKMRAMTTNFCKKCCQKNQNVNGECPAQTNYMKSTSASRAQRSTKRRSPSPRRGRRGRR
tara:strand:+ start:779 stop:2041 length:1263 start_codon:yes stop_codon:yes gene_type:complete